MQRRDCIAALLAATASPLVLAQGTPLEGMQYRRLPQPVSATGTNTPGKIEVIEFFWYGCPHCFVFDPALKRWLSTTPADVAFRRVHVGFGGLFRLHQRMFYTLEAMGVEAAMHDRVFNAFHVERVPTDNEAAMQDIAVLRLGLESAKFRQAWTSFGVQSKCMQATRLTDDFGIEGVPTLAIGGRYITAPDMAGSRGMSEQQLGVAALRVTDYLIELARKG